MTKLRSTSVPESVGSAARLKRKTLVGGGRNDENDNGAARGKDCVRVPLKLGAC